MPQRGVHLRVLHVPPTFFPAPYFGGPTRTVYSLCNHLAALPDVELRVLTTDTDGPTFADRISPDAIRAARFPGYDVVFCRKLAGADFSPSLMLRMWPQIAWSDVVHVTATYSAPTIPTLFAARTLGKPVVWSPRGGLQRWAKSSRVAAKRIWERICDLLLDSRRSVLHATSQAEAEESATRIRNARPVVIENGVDAPESLTARAWRPGGALRLLYLGRLDPKKGVENLLQALASLRDQQISLRICGAGAPDYESELAAKTDQLALRNSVTFVGSVDDAAKAREFLQADVCVVPSHTENFGMVVAEALAHGTPVIASRGTPWSTLEERAAGLWVANDPQSLADAITRMRGEELEAMGRAGREWMLESFGWRAIAERMLALYRDLVPGKDADADRIRPR